MLNKQGKIIGLAVLAVVILGIGWFLFLKPKEEFKLVPRQRQQEETQAKVLNTEVGTGWSVNSDAEKAVEEAVNMALKGKENKKPDFAVIFATSTSDMPKIFSKARQMLGEQAKIYGGTSSQRALMTNKGMMNTGDKQYRPEMMEGKTGLAIMTISSRDIVFGVGAANLKNYSSPREAAKEAVLAAIASAGQSPSELPKLVLITPTRLFEEEMLEGIEDVVGKKTMILGGTAGGPQRGVIGRDGVYEEGISLAVIYTNLPVGVVFKGGFDITDPHSGIITKANAQDIIEIDNRPALDVYNEWLGGEIGKLFAQYKNDRVVRDLLTLHPIYRKYRSKEGYVYFLFSHPWPKDKELKDKVVMTSTKIKVNERIYLSRGNWETLMNRIVNLPTVAKTNGDFGVDPKLMFGISYICNGVIGTIPESEWAKLPMLINTETKNIPFIACFTSGEQGYFPGIGNKHGNLLTSFILIGTKGNNQ